MHECPEFDEKGTCSDPKCKLQHIERAGKKRAAAAAVAPSATEMSGSGDGVSSTSDDDEDEEEFHSDVDSEDEFLGQPQQQPFGAENDDAMMQLDYIKF